MARRKTSKTVRQLSPDRDSGITPEQIRRLREALGLTQRELAHQLGLLNKQSVADAEAGRRELNPTAQMLLAQWRDELKSKGD